jgi:hypothetical protein
MHSRFSNLAIGLFVKEPEDFAEASPSSVNEDFLNILAFSYDTLPDDG